MKIASHLKNDSYQPVCEWPEDCLVQWGGSGIVVSDANKSLQGVMESDDPVSELQAASTYRTAFFEAFPSDPKTMIRGEGTTIVQAEMDAFEQLKRIWSCPGHDFERRNFRNGVGICKRCGLGKTDAFDPLEECCVCGCNTFYTRDTAGRWYCERHAEEMPREATPEWRLEWLDSSD